MKTQASLDALTLKQLNAIPISVRSFMLLPCYCKTEKDLKRLKGIDKE